MTQTQIDEIGDRFFRIHTPFTGIPGGFSFNQYLVVDDEPLLFHTGGRGMFAGVKAAIERVMPFEKLRWIGYSHVENDECGALEPMLAAAPNARGIAGVVGATIGLGDWMEPPVRPLADGEVLATGQRRFRWIDAPHMPHAWECGFMFEETTRTLLCGDLFTQPGADHRKAVVEHDILGPSEAFRAQMDYFSHTTLARTQIDKLAATEPRTLACMHGSAWRGDGARLLRALGDVLVR